MPSPPSSLSPAVEPAPLPSNLRPPGPSTNPFSSLRLLGRSTATWSASAEPAPTVPPAPVGVRVLTGGVVVEAAADGLWRSSDGGSSWQRTLTFAAGDTGFGLGSAGAGLAATAGSRQGDTTTVYESSDGLTWTSFTTSVSLADRTVRLRSAAPDSVGFAYPDVRQGITEGRDDVLRTTDGGRHWRATKVVGIAGIAFVPGSSAIIGAVTYAVDQPSDCGGHLVQSDDEGLSWRLIAGTCTGQSLYALEFVDPEHGFAAGGTPNHYAGSQMFYATSDGGRTWTRRYTTGAVGGGGSEYPDAFADIAFTSPTVGFAVSGACSGSDEGPCGGAVVATTDGGSSWRDTGATAVELSAGAGVVAVTGGGFWPIGGVGTQTSTDGGATWRRSIAPSDVAVTDLSRSSTGLLAATNAAFVTSADGGQTWHPYPLQLDRFHIQQFNVRVGGHGAIAEGNDFGRLAWSDDGGRTWLPQDAVLEGQSVDDVRLDASEDQRVLAYASQSDCSTTVFGSPDAGRTWSTVGRLPFSGGGYSEVVESGYDDHVAATVGQCGNRSYLAVSLDDGRDWTTRELGYGYDLIGAGVADGSVWLTGADTKGNRLVLVSQDEGVTWTAHDLVGITSPLGENGWPVPLSAQSALLWFGDGSLWRTTDAGATWRQQRPDLTPSS